MISALLHNESFFEAIEEENVIIEEDEISPEIVLEIEGENEFERYINTSNGSNKFWEICTENSNVIVQYGRIGTKGQRMVKAFESENDAKREMQKLIVQKISKEYFKE